MKGRTETEMELKFSCFILCGSLTVNNNNRGKPLMIYFSAVFYKYLFLILFYFERKNKYF